MRARGSVTAIMLPLMAIAWLAGASCVAEDDGDPCTVDVCVEGAPRYVYEDFSGYRASSGDGDVVRVVCDDPRVDELRLLDKHGTRDTACDELLDPPVDPTVGVSGDAAVRVTGGSDAAYWITLNASDKLADADYIYMAMTFRADLVLAEINWFLNSGPSDAVNPASTMMTYVYMWEDSYALFRTLCDGDNCDAPPMMNWTGRWVTMEVALDVAQDLAYWYADGELLCTRVNGSTCASTQALSMKLNVNTYYDSEDLTVDNLYIGTVPYAYRDVVANVTLHLPVEGPCTPPPPTPHPQPAPAAAVPRAVQRARVRAGRPYAHAGAALLAAALCALALFLTDALLRITIILGTLATFATFSMLYLV